ncbi:MAG: polysaccharide biosynthesis/export protein VpsN [Verrucomicrobiota bacterium]
MNVRNLGRWGALFGLLCAGFLLAGCHTDNSSQAFADVPGMTPAAAPGAAVASATNAAAAPANETGGTERIHIGDNLVIIFSDLPNPQQPSPEQVRDDGTITLPLNQTFTAVGKTRGELAREIRARYVPDYYVNLTVIITPQDRFYYVGGEVKGPSRQAYIGRITVLKAIQSCGDFTDFANKKKVTLTRTDGHIHRINCIKAREHPELDLEVYPGDKIDVPRKLF